MRRLLTALLGGACLAAAVHAQDPAVVQGQVVDGAGEPVPWANVQIAGTTDGAASGRDGRFRFATRHLGRRQVVASFIGCEPARRSVQLSPGDTAAVRLVLRRVLIELGETAVGSDHYQALFTIGIFLFVVTFIINLCADLVVRGVRKG